MKPIEHVVIGRLLFNKSLVPFHDSMTRMVNYVTRNRVVDEIKVVTTDNFAVDMARNWIVQEVLNNNESFRADAIVWLDTDMIYPDDSLARLVEMANAGYYIAAGIYRRGRPPHQILTEIEWGQATTLDELDALAQEQLPVEVSMTAGGFSIVRVEVYRAIADKIGLPWYCNWDFRTNKFACGEDRFFIYRAAEVGVKPVVDPTLGAVHWPPFSSPVPVREGQPELQWTE